MNAALKFVRNQVVEVFMETRIAKLESDVEHIKDDAADLKRDMRAANDGIAALQKDVSAIAATVPHLATKAEMQAMGAALKAMETNMIRWLLGTAVAIAALGFGIARFVAPPTALPATAGVSASSSSGDRNGPQSQDRLASEGSATSSR